jgi:hypothetical protein
MDVDAGHPTRLYHKISLMASPPLLPEIWQAIFENEPLIWDGFSNIRLTCKAFAALAQPIAFRYFHLNPSFQHNSPTMKNGTARNMARLGFWATDEIARHVREIHVHDVHQGDRDPVLDIFFQVLPRFTNAQKLSCHTILFEDFALDQLYRLKNLRTLDLYDSSVKGVIPARAQALRLRSLTIVDEIQDYGQERDKTSVEWLLFIHPDHIQHVDLTFWDPEVAKDFLRFSMTTDTAQYVTDMSIPHSDALVRLLISALSCSQPCRLRKLAFEQGYDALNGPAPSVSVPSLHTYRGPHQSLLPFLPGEAIHDLSLGVAPEWVGFADPATLADTLRHLPNSIANVKNLFLSLTRMTRDVLEIVCSRCVSLQNFSCRIGQTFDLSNIDMARDVRLATFRRVCDV